MTAIDHDLIAAGLLLLTVAMVVAGTLAGWNNWLALRRFQIDVGRVPADDTGHPATRIELADLKERVRRLEAIAAGVDL
ncbi:MAG: hypothetical protein PGN09_02140 [Sphingomonas fennica]